MIANHSSCYESKMRSAHEVTNQKTWSKRHLDSKSRINDIYSLYAPYRAKGISR